MSKATKNAMEVLQGQITDWQDATFPKANVHSTMCHLIKEVEELSRTLRRENLNEIREELADCQHLLFGIASKRGINLYDATMKKFEINKSRKWGEPDKNGVVEHL